MKYLTIVTLGNSITNGIREGVDEADTYRHILQQELSKAIKHEVKVINAGVNGDITTTAIGRLKKDVLKYNPDYVTIMFGVNDAGYYRPATDSMADTPRVSSINFKRNLEVIIQSIKNINSKPVLITPVPMNSNYAHKDFPAYIKNGLNYLVDEYSHIIRHIALDANIPLIDVHKAFSKNTRSKEMVPDGIHPNKDGHKLISRIFLENFLKLIE
ncbi:hypothetical protein GF312_06915 [Candidatus Poribacteria bacterium]|nr:hypothetical protein [Candidatus Poribacteria bacterium]